MLRGFRWQFVALVAAAILFPAALLSRVDNSPAESVPTPQASVSPPAATVAPTISPSPGLVIEPVASSDQVATYREGLVGSVQRLNPLLADLNPAEQDITRLIFQGLTQIDAYGEAVPALASNWIISSDRLEYVITLRDDVLWQDGVPFNADDVIFTMQTLSAPDFPGSAEQGAFWRSVETEKLGSHLVRFRLTQPLGSFLTNLRIGLLPAHALQGTPAAALAAHPFNLSPIGTGPYQLESLRSGSDSLTQVDLRVAPVYRQRPEGQQGYAIDRLSFHIYTDDTHALAALSAGEIDGLASAQRLPLLTAALGDNLNIHTTLDAAVGMLIFNWQQDDLLFFREQRVRLALVSALDRKSIVERWLHSRAAPANSPLWPGSWAYIDDLRWPSNDLATARFLLDTANLNRRTSTESDDEAEATEEPTQSPYLLSFNVLAPDDPDLQAMLQEVAAQWSQLNVNVQIEAVDAETYLARLSTGDFDSALVELSSGGSADPDVYSFWHQGQYPDGSNYGGMDDNNISELLERARRDPSGINRHQLYSDFQREFVQRAIAIPLYYPLFTYATAADGVQLGFVAAPEDRFLTLQDWTISP